MQRKVCIIVLMIIGFSSLNAAAIFIDSSPVSIPSPPFMNIDTRGDVTIEVNTSGVAYGQELLWTANTTGTNYEESAVVYTDEIAYIGSCSTHGAGYDKIFAVDTTTGEILWSNNTGPGYVGPVIDGDVVYIGSCTHGYYPEDEYIYAFNRFTGEQLWKVPIYGGIAESIQYDADKIYFCTGFYETKIYALNKDDGSINWTYQTGYEVCANKPMLKDNAIYGAFWDDYDVGRLYKINATNGHEIWSIALSAGPWDNSITADGEGRLFLAIYYDGTMNAYSELDGHLLWSYPLHGRSLSFNAYHNGRVFIADTEGYVYAFKASDGTLVWETKIGGTCDISSPTVSGGLVFIGTRDGPDGAFYALDENTGSLLWRYGIGASVTCPPSIADGMMFCGSDGWNMYAFDVGDGSGAWVLHRYDSWNTAYSPTGLSNWEYVQASCTSQQGMTTCVVANTYDHSVHNITLRLPFSAYWYSEEGTMLKQDAETFTIDTLSSGASFTLLITDGPLFQVTLIKPENAIYFVNKKVIPFFFPLVFGRIDIEATVRYINESDVDRVEFFVDNNLQTVDTTAPYTYQWSKRSFGFHQVKVVAYQNNVSVSDEILVCKIF